MKSLGLENKNLIDVWQEVGQLDVDVDGFLKFQDNATEIQIEAIKQKALVALQDAMAMAESDKDRIAAAKGLLQHFRDEKRRTEKNRLIKGDSLLHGAEWGPWNTRVEE